MNHSKFSFLLALLFVLASGQLHAYDLEGTVYDYDRSPLVDATIRLLTVQRVNVGSEVTNARGEYRIRGIAAGLYTMEITKVGMKKVSMEVSVSGLYYQATIYKDIYLNELIRFESVKPSELKGLFIPEGEFIPVSAFSRYLKGVKKFDKKNYKSALKDFEKAISRHPGFSRCYTYIGDIRSIEGKFQEAESAFIKAIELNPHDPFPLTGLGRLLIGHEDYPGARTYLESAVMMDPSRAEIYFLLGEALYKTGQLENAEKNLLQGLMIQPRQSGKTRIILADIFADQKRYSESRDQLSAYLRDNPFAEDKTDILDRIQRLEKLILSLDSSGSEERSAD